MAFLKYFWNFHPYIWGRWTHFDFRIFFKRLGWFNHQRVDNSRGCRVCTALTRRLKKAGPFDSRRWDDGPRSLGGRGFGWWDEGGGEFGWTEIFWCPDFGHLKDSFLPEIKQQSPLKSWKNAKTGCWFQRFFIFTRTWGNDPTWLIFFRWVGSTTN